MNKYTPRGHINIYLGWTVILVIFLEQLLEYLSMIFTEIRLALATFPLFIFYKQTVTQKA